MSSKDIVTKKIEDLDFAALFVIDELSGKEYSYKEFFSCCLNVADKLSDYNEKQIFAVLENGIQLLSLYFVSIFANKEIVVFDPDKGIAEIEKIRSEYPNAIHIINSNGLEVNLDFLNEHTNKEGDIKREVCNRFENYDFSGAYLTTFTSGTSGNTKGVINSLDNLFLTIFSMNEKLNLVAGGTFFHLLPMTYMAGILNSIFMPFILGYRIVIYKRFSVTTAMLFWKIVEKHSVNFVWASPMMLTMIEKVDRSDRYENYCKDHSIDFLVGTAPLYQDTRLKFLNRYTVKLRASYGLSETLFISVETDWSLNKASLDNVGEILNGVEYILTEDDEMLIKVPWMFLGYSNTDTEEYFYNGYYRTGDIVDISDEILTITGRKKDLIIRGGMNISPKYIEDFLMSLEFIEECVIYGEVSDLGDENVCCAYVRRNEYDQDEYIEKKILGSITEKLGKNYHIDKFVELKSLPRNLNGKVDRQGIINGQY